MTTGSSIRAKVLADGRRADSARRRQRVIAAINRAVTDGTEISVSAIARAAAVDRTFLYRHRDLLGKIHATQAGPPSGNAPARLSPGHPCKPTCSPPTTALSGSPPASSSSKNACPKRSATRPGANPGSAPPPTSTRSTTRSPISTSTSPTCSSSWKNVTANSCRPRRQPGTHGPAQRDSTPLTHHQVHHTCGARRSASELKEPASRPDMSDLSPRE